MSKLVEIYNSHPYEPLVPTESKPDQMVFKFNSPQHYISWVEALDKNFPCAARTKSSETEPKSFSQSESLEDAYRVVRETEFTPTDNSRLESKLSKLRKLTEFSDDGHEIDVPEYLSGSERVWLKDKSARKPTRMIDDVLLLDANYSAYVSSEKMKAIGIKVLDSIYRRGVIPRKLVLAFVTTKLKTGGKPDKNLEYITTIDVNFSDLNGAAKILHPAAFRRLWFRLVEQYPDLTGGYGVPYNGATERGYLSLQKIHGYTDDNVEKEIDKFLGVTN